MAPSGAPGHGAPVYILATGKYIFYLIVTVRSSTSRVKILLSWREKCLLYIPRRQPAIYNYIVRVLIEYKNEKICHMLNTVKYINGCYFVPVA